MVVLVRGFVRNNVLTGRLYTDAPRTSLMTAQFSAATLESAACNWVESKLVMVIWEPGLALMNWETGPRFTSRFGYPDWRNTNSTSPLL